MSLNETYTTMLVGKDLSDTVPIKNDLKQRCFTETYSQLYCTICHYEASEKKQEGLKQNGTHRLLIYADNVIYRLKAYKLQRKTQKISYYIKNQHDATLAAAES